MQTVVLAGATGFIGQHLQRTLAAAGFDLHVLVRPASARGGNVIGAARVTRLALDDQPALERALAGAAFAIYCAGAVRGRTPADFEAANVAGPATFAAAAVRAMAVPRMLHISSLAASRAGVSDYAASKRAGEDRVRGVEGLQWVILRPPAVYGPGDRELRPLFTAIRCGIAVVPGPRGQRVSLLHVHDLARAVHAVLTAFDTCAGAVHELDDGHALGWGWDEIVAAARGRLPVLRVHVPRALLGLVARFNARLSVHLGYRPMLTPGKVRELSEVYWLCNNRPFTAATGWSPRIELREGVREPSAPS